MGCSGENCTLVIFEHLDPRLYIRSVILAKLRRQIKVGGQKCGAKLGDKFFHRVAFVATTLATEISVKARFVASPVDCLMRPDLHAPGRLTIPYKIVKGRPADPMRRAQFRDRERNMVFNG